MAITVYSDKDFKGAFARLGPGTYSGDDLRGSSSDLNNDISSVRVGAGTIAVLVDGYAVDAAGSGSRVLVGPAEVADLSAIGMDDRVSSVRVIEFRPVAESRRAAATVYDGYGATGRRSDLDTGDYSGARLAGGEVKLPGDRIVSLAVEPNTVVVIYAGADFESSMDAAVVAGPVIVADLNRLGFGGRVRSIRVLAGELPHHHALPPPPRARAQQAQHQMNDNDLTWLPTTSGTDNDSTGPTIYVVQPTERRRPSPDARLFLLIALFIIVVAFAAFMSGQIAKSPAEKRAAEANIGLQGAVPLAVTAALMS
ncbi:MAG: hypothetical protein WC700_10150 [Gemmatimonadaceae bacterium]|jgi:hypothetical protein